jgi:cobalt-zinc-cadmium efflux system protein
VAAHGGRCGQLGGDHRGRAADPLYRLAGDRSILSILIGIAIVWSGWGIIRDYLNILLEGLPKGLELKKVSGELSQLPGVIDVHDLHIWSLGSESRALSCHVLIDDMPPSESDSILRRINDVLCARFHITHTTIQFEHVKCILAETHCIGGQQANGCIGTEDKTFR